MTDGRVPWTRALIEGLVIVGSILLAFGIDAAWERRGERQEQREAIAEILSNLAADSLDQAAMGRNAQRYRQASVWALDHLGADLPDDSVAVALQPLSGVGTYQPVRSGYVGLRDSGRLDFIEPEELRARVIQYYEVEQVTQVSRVERLEARLYEVYEAAELDVHRRTDIAARGDGLRFELARPWSAVPSDPRLVPRLKALAYRAGVNDLRIRELLQYNRELQEGLLALLDAT